MKIESDYIKLNDACVKKIKRFSQVKKNDILIWSLNSDNFYNKSSDFYYIKDVNKKNKTWWIKLTDASKTKWQDKEYKFKNDDLKYYWFFYKPKNKINKQINFKFLHD